MKSRPGRLRLILQGFKYLFYFHLILGLVFASGLFTLMLLKDIKASKQRTYFIPSDTGTPVGVLELETSEAYLGSSEVSQNPLSAMIDAPVVKQYPELYNGCEVTALAMLLQYYGIYKDKMDLMSEMKVDPTKIKYNQDGSIRFWGDPNAGFVGDITGKQIGYGIYAQGIFPLLSIYIPDGINMTGQPFSALEQKIAAGIPVMVWTTVNFGAPADHQWMSWNSPNGTIKATFQEHTVLLVGYDDKHVYVNDPRQGIKNLKLEKEPFIQSWEALGKQALSYNEFK